MRLYLIRHPRPLLASGICYGSTDVDVAPQEAELAAARLAVRLPPAIPVWSSPLRRCTVLSERLAARLGSAGVTYDARLVELHFGAWEGRPWDEIRRAEVDAWAGDLVGYRPGGGESVLQAAARVGDFLRAMRGRGQAAVVCHAGVIRLILAHGGGRSLDAAAAFAAGPASVTPAYGSLTVFEA